MTPENFQEMLEPLLLRRPFKAFTVALHDGTRFAIDGPLATVCRGGKAVFVSPGGVLIYFDNECVSQIIDAPAHSAP